MANWPNGELVYSSLEAPHRTTLPEKTALSRHELSQQKRRKP